MTSETGLFWLPDTPESAVRGRLDVTSGGVSTLELMDGLTPSLRVVSHDAETGEVAMVQADDPVELLVHGILEGRPRRVTLLDCWTPGRRTISTNCGSFEEQTLRAGRVVRGAHVSRGAQFTGLRVRVASIEGLERPGAVCDSGSPRRWCTDVVAACRCQYPCNKQGWGPNAG